MSPDVEEILNAIESIQGHTIVPENIESTVYHFISSLGPDAIYACSGRSMQFKMGYIIGYSQGKGSK